MKKKILIMSLLLISALAILIKTVFPHLLKEEALVTVVSERDMESASIHSIEMPEATTDAEVAAFPAGVNTENAEEEELPEEEEIPEETGDDDAEVLAKALYQAHLRLFAETMVDEINFNYNDHPNIGNATISNTMAFAILGNGAKGDALEQMEYKILGETSIDKMNDVLFGMAERMQNSEEVKWSITNAVWYKNDNWYHNAWKLSDGYVTGIRQQYGADVTELDYTIDDVNKYVSDQTMGAITEQKDMLWSRDSVLSINTMTYEGMWMKPYDSNDILENREFINADGTISDVTMLCSTEEQYFALGDGFGFLREYKGGEYSFMGLLPEEGSCVEDYLVDLATDKQDLADAIQNGYSSDVIVQIPEFTVDYRTDSHSIYAERGMDLPFQMEEADFSGMIKGDCYVSIDEVVHTTHINLDRNGSEAMAATTIEMDVRPVSESGYGILFGECPWYDRNRWDIDQIPVEIILDRPFIYGIIDNKTGMPIMLGMVNHL